MTMTFTVRLRYLVVWYLLTVADWIAPPLHRYRGVGENVAHNYCVICGRDYYEGHPCHSRRDQVGYRTRLLPRRTKVSAK